MSGAVSDPVPVAVLVPHPVPASPGLGLIWAQAHDRVIGASGGMPWHVPEDLAHFKELTDGSTVVMGRKTWDALDPRFKPLPGRRNVVVTRDPEWAAEGAEVAHDLDASLASPAPVAPHVTTSATAATAATAQPPDLWVIGGAELFAATIDRADRLEVTELDLEVDGDTWAPPIGSGWRVTDEGEWQESRGGVRFRFLRYGRVG